VVSNCRGSLRLGLGSALHRGRRVSGDLAVRRLRLLVLEFADFVHLLLQSEAEPAVAVQGYLRNRGPRLDEEPEFQLL